MVRAPEYSDEWFETFAAAAVVYLVMCQAVNLTRIGVGRWFFPATRGT